MPTSWVGILFQSISFSLCLNLVVLKESLFCQTRGLACLVVVVGGGGRNQASRGGGPWRLIGNGPPVNVNGNQGFVQPWLTLYTDPSTQDKLSLAVTLLTPLPLTLSISTETERGQAQRMEGKIKLWDTDEIPREDKKEQCLKNPAC